MHSPEKLINVINGMLHMIDKQENQDGWTVDFLKHIKLALDGQQERIVKYESALKRIASPEVGIFLTWQDEQERKGNDLNEWDWFSSIAKDALK